MRVKTRQQKIGESSAENPPRFQVLSVGIHAVTWDETFQKIDRWIAEKQPNYINVCSVQTVLDSYDSAELSHILNSSGMSVPDGMPLVWLGKLSGTPVDRIYGPDLVLALCDRGQKLGYRHFFYGGAPGIADRMSENLRRRYPALKIVGTCAPPFRDLTPQEEMETAQMINQTRPDIVWVGLGTPKQDFWMARMRPFLEAPVLIAVGAAFDLHSGRIRQAPHWMRHAGLEWLFRLMMEPRRLWRRYLFGNPRFIYLIFKQLSSKRQV